MKKRLLYTFFLCSIVSCYKQESAPIIQDTEAVLSTFLEDKTYVNDEVIACAASNDMDSDLISVFFYPEAEATDFRLYESWSEDALNFSSYNFVGLQSIPVFQGALRSFRLTSNSKWFVVVFEKEGNIEISTPISNKYTIKPTIWTDEVGINQMESGMPNFYWEHNSVGDNAIYFQVISAIDDSLLSGTYTYDNDFQYYKTDNVVLNVTTQTPPDLIIGNEYNFTLMDVSLDNWVNLVIQKSFEAQ